MALKEQFFDFEVFPNWWCCVIGRYPVDDKEVPERLKEEFIVIRSDIGAPREDLLEIMCDKEYVSMGYNIKRYDNIILNGVASSFSPRQLKILSDIIIDPEVQYSSAEAMRIGAFAKKRYNNFVYQDLLDDNDGSLKQKEACMQLDIRESDVDFNKEDLSDEDIADVISYCKHDVWASMKFYQMVIKPFVATKLLVGKVFNIPMDVCYKSTNATLSGKALGAERTSFKDKERMDIEIPEQLKSYIQYALPSTITNRLCASPDKFEVELFGNLVSYTNGGIHSVPIRPAGLKKTENWCLRACANDDWVLCDVDASSFYPALMINFKLLSRAVKRPEMFRDMYLARLDFKSVIDPFEEKWYKIGFDKAPREEYEKYVYCKETSQAYKLILNTTFGASGNKWLDLFDPYMTTCTCRIGQLVITALANNIYTQIGKQNVQIVQTNTDGVLCYIRKDMLPLLHQIGDEFTRITDILLEYGMDDTIWQRDVNNYIMLKKNGKEKSKGGFFVTDMIQPGYNRVRPLDAYVCRDAVKLYLEKGKDIVEHIYGEQDLSKFVITCNKGTAREVFQTFNDGREDKYLHKCNRAIASLDKNLGEIKLNYYRLGNKTVKKSSGCPPHCYLVNYDLKGYNFAELQDTVIDYMWYIEKTLEMLSDPWYEMQGDKIVPIQIININDYQ